MLTAISLNLFSQDSSEKSLRFMFYNVENLFDTFDDTLKEDNDFLPTGLMRWNFTRYSGKIHSLYKTITAAGGWNPPVLVAMCEVENRKVLEDLVFDTYLSKYHYRIIHEDSPDKRGIDVCMILREDCASLIHFEYWRPPEDRKVPFTSRSVLYSKIAIGSDTLHIIMNHWPSRRGGVLAGEGLRMIIAQMVRSKIDSINEFNSEKPKIIISGDFNCTPGDKEVNLLTNQTYSDNPLINLSEIPAKQGCGTYRFKGTWEMIDQVLVSEELLTGTGKLYTNTEMFKVYKPDFLLRKDPKYPGASPFSTFSGYKYQGGYSDHLPVLLDLGFKPDH